MGTGLVKFTLEISSASSLYYLTTYFCLAVDSIVTPKEARPKKNAKRVAAAGTEPGGTSRTCPLAHFLPTSVVTTP